MCCRAVDRETVDGLRSLRVVVDVAVRNAVAPGDAGGSAFIEQGVVEQKAVRTRSGADD
jgi:hypothetical protein